MKLKSILLDTKMELNHAVTNNNVDWFPTYKVRYNSHETITDAESIYFFATKI